MRLLHLALNLEMALLLVLSAGLVGRRRAALCWSFVAYALVVASDIPLSRLCYETTWAFDYYVFKETTVFVLKALVALEIWQRTFAVFPRARLRVGVLLAFTLLLLLAAVRIAPSEHDQWTLYVGVVAPRLQVGALALYVVVVLGARWYLVPLHEFHRAVLLGFGVYLVVHALTLAHYGWNGGSPESYYLGLPIKLVAYLATVTWWAWAAWRPLRARSSILSRLQPWARSS